MIAASLKRTGVIELTEREKIDAALDKAFPNAPSKQTVEFEGKWYRIRYYPASKSRSGKVKGWDHSWEPV
jgi:hypothetical protein